MSEEPQFHSGHRLDESPGRQPAVHDVEHRTVIGDDAQVVVGPDVDVDRNSVLNGGMQVI